jgi:hypothetical protein
MGSLLTLLTAAPSGARTTARGLDRPLVGKT